jgi:hypothetical protein
MITNQKEWTESLRDISLLPGSPITQAEGQWEVTTREETWNSVGPRLFDEHLERFLKVAVEVLRERDPKFELEREQRFAASIYEKVLEHSHALRKGLSETLALLGSRPEPLTSCSTGKPEIIASTAVREILKNADWVLWASLNDRLPSLAEASPNTFLDTVETALARKPSPFVEVFAQESAGFMGSNYLTGLLWAMETLAWSSDYLQRVTVLLGELAAIDPGGNWVNRPLNSLTDIFLPWHPQTCAPISKRKAAITALVKEQPAVAWNLIVSLLPSSHGVTSGCHKPSWRKFIPTEWSEKVTHSEYWEQIGIYADMLVEIAASDTTKLTELVKQLPHLPNPAHTRVLDVLNSETVRALPEQSRIVFWEALTSLAAKHRKFSTANWALPIEAVAKIEATASCLAPKSLGFLYRRLFSERDHELFDEKSDFEEQQKNLNLRRQAAVLEILEANGLEGLLVFARQVTNPGSVGHAFGGIEWESADSALLPECLSKEDKVIRDFVSNFVWSRFWTKGWTWVNDVPMGKWTADQKATFFTLLPFGYETWQRAESALGNESAIFWKKVNVQPYGPHQPHLIETVERLLQHGRPLGALVCLGRLVHGKSDFPPTLAVQALMDYLKAPENGSFDQYTVSEIIKWLQENPATNPDALFKVEWAYLALLDHDYGGTPKTLEHRLATDPAAFCDLMAIVFRSDKEEAKDREFSQPEKNIAQNAYRLLNGWQTAPGRTATGAFDRAAFSQWLEEVSKRTKESGHYRIALDQIGKVLPYAPPDPDGLWIHRSVAEALNERDAGEMRSGFICEFFNSRGVHGFSAGKEERELAASFNAKADALEERGYQRIATAVRGLAKDYEREAEREEKEPRF